MNLKKMTANLYTDDVAACARFWTGRMGFEKTVEVPEEGGKLAFVALQKGNLEVMYGSYASLERELFAGAFHKGTSYLFMEVDDVAAAEKAMAGATVVAKRHTTFYGADEFTVQDPAGHFLTFAQFAAQASPA